MSTEIVLNNSSFPIEYNQSFILDYSQSTFYKVKSFTFRAKDKVINFMKKPETKIASLIGYWAAEATFTALAFYAFIVTHMYGAAFAAVLLLALLTYSVFGVVGEATN